MAPLIVASTEPKDSAAADTDAYNRHTDGQKKTKDEKSHDSFAPVEKLHASRMRKVSKGDIRSVHVGLFDTIA